MIEQAIYFALGCCVTGLLALLFAPVLWQRALRLTRQRLQLQVPLSMQEILAERDQLRAQFAVERLRIEQTYEAVQATKGHDMAEIGRRTMEIAALAEEIQTLKETVAIQTKSLEEAHRGGDDRATQLDALNVSLQENATKLAEYRRRAETAEADRSRLLSETDSQRTSIASLKTVGMSLEIRLVDAERALAAEREAAAALRTRLETAMEHAARHESAGLLVRRELDDAKIQRRQVEADLVAAQIAMKTLREEHDRHVAAHEGLQSDHEKAILAVRNDLDDSRRRAGRALAELEVAEISLAEVRTREEEATRKLAVSVDQDKAALHLRRELDETRARLRQSEDALRASDTAQREVREQDASSVKGQRNEQEAAVLTVRRELEDAKAQIRRLQDDMRAARAAEASARKENDDLQVGLGAQQQSHDSSLAEQATALAALRVDHQALVARAEDAASRLAAAEVARDAAVQELERLRTRDDADASTRQQLDETRARARQLQNELGAAQASLAEAERERQVLSDGQSAVQAEHANASLLMRRDLDDAKAQVRKLDEKLLQANVLLGEAREMVEQHRTSTASDRTRDEAALTQARAETRQLADDLARSQEELAHLRTALETASDREKAMALQRSLQADKEQRALRRYQDQLQVLAADNDAMKEALAGADPQGAMSAGRGGDETGLRASIHALGIAVAQLTRDAQETAVEDGRRPRKDEKPRPLGVA